MNGQRVRGGIFTSDPLVLVVVTVACNDDDHHTDVVVEHPEMECAILNLFCLLCVLNVLNSINVVIEGPREGGRREEAR